MAGQFKYRCKFLCKGMKVTPADFNKWAKNPPDGGLPLCRAAYDLCHSPCDLLHNDETAERMFEQTEGAG